MKQTSPSGVPSTAFSEVFESAPCTTLSWPRGASVDETVPFMALDDRPGGRPPFGFKALFELGILL